MSQEFADLPASPSGSSLVEVPVRRPGFGGFMAIVWCLAYMVVMQVLAGLICAIPIFSMAAYLDKPVGGADAKELMNRPAMVIATMLTLVCSHLSGLAFGVFVLRWRVGGSWKSRIALNRRPAGLHVALAVIGFPALLALATLVDTHLTSHVPSADQLLAKAGINFKFGGLDQMLALFQATPLPLALLAVAVLPGINEELWCRGYLGNGLSSRYSVWPTVLITSLLFGMLHVDPRQGTGAALLGVAIHFAYLATRSMWMAIGLHFANNATAVIHLNSKLEFPVLQPYEEMAERTPWLFLCAALALFLPIAYAFWQTRGQLTRVRPEGTPWRPRGKNNAEIPPAESGIEVTHEPIRPMTVLMVVAGAFAFGVLTVI